MSDTSNAQVAPHIMCRTPRFCVSNLVHPPNFPYPLVLWYYLHLSSPLLIPLISIVSQDLAIGGGEHLNSQPLQNGSHGEGIRRRGECARNVPNSNSGVATIVSNSTLGLFPRVNHFRVVVVRTMPLQDHLHISSSCGYFQ